MKEKYHINIGTGDITQENSDNNAAYTIFANDEEVSELRGKLENMHDASNASFLRAHIPIMPYHKQPQNKEYDANLREVFTIIHELGDDQAKEHVQSLGILSENDNNPQ